MRLRPYLACSRVKPKLITVGKEKLFLLQAEQQIVLPFCEDQRIAPLPRENDSTDFLVDRFR